MYLDTIIIQIKYRFKQDVIKTQSILDITMITIQTTWPHVM